MQPEPDKINRSLRLSLYDGICTSAMVGFSQDYLAPFLLSIGATVRQIGILSAVPSLAASLLQLKSGDITDRLGSRKKVINIFVLLQALMLILMAVMVMTGGNVYVFIGMVTLFTAFGAFAAPAWGSMMSDLVPENKRGDYFGWRTMITGIVTIAATFAAGFIVHYCKSFNITAGFALIFLGAFVFRMGSWSFLRMMYEPVAARNTDGSITFTSFLSGIRENTFTRFVLAVSFMNFSVYLAAPFFSVLMLRELQFSYLLYTVIIVTGNLMVFLSIRRWGKHADHIGNISIIKLTSLLISILPLLWIINRNPVYLIVIQVFAGLVWGGFNISTFNFIFDAVPSPDRTRSIAYFNVINGIAIFAGSLTGGTIMHRLPSLFGSQILTLLFISSVLRFMGALFLIPGLQEVRTVKRVNGFNLFSSMIGIRSILDIEKKPLQ